MKDILILTPKIKLRVGSILVSLILFCLAIQVSVILYNINVLNADQEGTVEASKVEATATNSSFTASDTIYQTFLINDATVDLPVAETYQENDSVPYEENASIPVWFAADDGTGFTDLKDYKSTRVDGMVYSLDSFRLGPTTNTFLLVISTALLTLIVGAVIALAAEKFIVLLKSDDVPGFNEAFSDNGAHMPPPMIIFDLQMLIAMICNTLLATITFYVISYNSPGGVTERFLVIIPFVTIMFTFLCSMLYQGFSTSLEKPFMRLCWGNAIGDVNASDVDWSNHKATKKATRWFKRNGADKETLEIITALLPTFSGPLKNLNEVAVHFKAEPK